MIINFNGIANYMTACSALHGRPFGVFDVTIKYMADSDCRRLIVGTTVADRLDNNNEAAIATARRRQ